jgi:hypothetical protein
VAGCGGDLGSSATLGIRQLRHDRSAIPAELYVDALGKPIGQETLASMSLEKVAGDLRTPVLAPDGTSVTWGEFSAASGVASLACRVDGTWIRLAMKGFIPKGVYSAWFVPQAS